MGKIEAYRKQTGSNDYVFFSLSGLRFRAWPIYAGFTHCPINICKYLAQLLA